MDHAPFAQHQLGVELKTILIRAVLRLTHCVQMTYQCANAPQTPQFVIQPLLVFVTQVANVVLQSALMERQYVTKLILTI